MLLRTIWALFKLVAVHSIKIFFVKSEILVYWPLIIGGKDKTKPNF